MTGGPAIRVAVSASRASVVAFSVPPVVIPVPAPPPIVRVAGAPGVVGGTPTSPMTAVSTPASASAAVPSSVLYVSFPPLSVLFPFALSLPALFLHASTVLHLASHGLLLPKRIISVPSVAPASRDLARIDLRHLQPLPLQEGPVAVECSLVRIFHAVERDVRLLAHHDDLDHVAKLVEMLLDFVVPCLEVEVLDGNYTLGILLLGVSDSPQARVSTGRRRSNTHASISSTMTRALLGSQWTGWRSLERERHRRYRQAGGLKG